MNIRRSLLVLASLSIDQIFCETFAFVQVNYTYPLSKLTSQTFPTLLDCFSFCLTTSGCHSVDASLLNDSTNYNCSFNRYYPTLQYMSIPIGFTRYYLDGAYERDSCTSCNYFDPNINASSIQTNELMERSTWQQAAIMFITKTMTSDISRQIKYLLGKQKFSNTTIFYAYFSGPLAYKLAAADCQLLQLTLTSDGLRFITSPINVNTMDNKTGVCIKATCSTIQKSYLVFIPIYEYIRLPDKGSLDYSYQLDNWYNINYQKGDLVCYMYSYFMSINQW